MITIIAGLSGVVIGALITAFFSERREKKKLIKDLQIKATDDVLKDLKNFASCLSEYSSFVVTLTIILDNEIRKVQPINENIFEKFISLKHQYNDSYFVFMNNFESKRVIFNKFWGMRNYFFDTDKEFSNIAIELSYLLSRIYQLKVLKNAFLDDEEFEKLVTLCKRFNEKYSDLASYLYDFTVELQNEFLSKLFKCKVPRRVVHDEDLKVLTTDLKYECQWYDKYLKTKETVNM